MRKNVPNSIRHYWNTRDELRVLDGVTYKGMKVVILTRMRKQMIVKSHTSHLGMHVFDKQKRYFTGLV